MAHFAQLDQNNVVLQVIVVKDADTSDANGVEKEHIGQAFCERHFGGTWIQTSYNANFRRSFAGIGSTYDQSLDAFLDPKPYPSWVLNSDTLSWQAPIPKPTDENKYSWNEETQQWVADE